MLIVGPALPAVPVGRRDWRLDNAEAARPVTSQSQNEPEGFPRVKLIRQQEKAFSKRIPYAVLFTRTSAALKPLTLRHIQDQLVKHGVRAFETQIHERDAYPALFSFGGTLSSLNPAEVRNIEAAVINARAFAGELVAMLREGAQNTTQTAQVA